MKTYNSFGDLAADNMTTASGLVSDMTVFNITQVSPKVAAGNSKLQAYLNKHWIGSKGLEYESPHITIEQQFGDRHAARLLLSTCELMESTKVDKEVIKAVQHDMAQNPNKYIGNWNENNPDHAMPLKQEKQNEQPQKDESWKEAQWYKDSQ